MNKHKLGRPPLPIQKRVAWRVLWQLGGKRHIRWLLMEDGATKTGLIRSIGMRCTRERARQLIKELRINVPRDHSVVWHIVRLCHRENVRKWQSEHATVTLARKFADQKWLNRQTKRLGSFAKLTEEKGFSRSATQVLRGILNGEGFRIPRKNVASC